MRLFVYLAFCFTILNDIYYVSCAPIDSDEDVSENAVSDAQKYSYDSWRGLFSQVKDVSETSVKELAKASTKISLSFGGLASNAASQSLKSTGKLLKSLKNKLKNGVAVIGKLNDCGMEMADKAVKKSSDFFLNNLGSIADYLDSKNKLSDKTAQTLKQLVSESTQSSDGIPKSKELDYTIPDKYVDELKEIVSSDTKTPISATDSAIVADSTLSVSPSAVVKESSVDNSGITDQSPVAEEDLSFDFLGF